MRIAYFSSVLNHHQIEFCDNMYRIHGDGFTFVSTMDIEQQRIALGYKLYTRPYNLLITRFFGIISLELYVMQGMAIKFFRSDYVYLDNPFVYTHLFCVRELESKQVGSGSRCGGIALQSDGASILRHRRCKALINNVI